MSLLWNVLFYSLVTVAETSPRYTRVLIFHISVCSCPLIWEGARGEGVLGHHPLNHPLLSFSAQEWRIPPSSLSQHGGCAPNPLFPYTFSFSAFLTPSTLRQVSHFRQRKMAAITHTHSLQLLFVSDAFFERKIIKKFARRLKPGAQQLQTGF
jgi:hypothetical protein